MGEPQHAPGITHRQVSGLNEIGATWALAIAASRCRTSASPPTSRARPNLPLEIARQHGFDPDVEGIRRDIQEEADRATRHDPSLTARLASSSSLNTNGLNAPHI